MNRSIICFIGTDGAGKSTIISELKQKLEQKYGSEVRAIYFGWKPFLPTTKLLSFILRKRNYQIADKMNSENNKKEEKFSLFQEIMLSYYYAEYLFRYLFQLRMPSLLQRRITLVDRYFYDMYAHYQYAGKSVIFPILLKIMPKPDLTIFLDTSVQIAKQRKPEMDLQLLQRHYQRYQELSKLIGARAVKTDQKLEQSVHEVLTLLEERLQD